jgi:hypothetical protein
LQEFPWAYPGALLHPFSDSPLVLHLKIHVHFLPNSLSVVDEREPLLLTVPEQYQIIFCISHRHTDQKKSEAAKTWKDKKYAVILVQPNGEQLGIIADYMKEVRTMLFNVVCQYMYRLLTLYSSWLSNFEFLAIACAQRMC